MTREALLARLDDPRPLTMAELELYTKLERRTLRKLRVQGVFQSVAILPKQKPTTPVVEFRRLLVALRIIT